MSSATASKPQIEFGRGRRLDTEISRRTRWESIDGRWRIERLVPEIGPRPKRNGAARPGGLPIAFLLLRRHPAGHWEIVSRHRTHAAAIAAANRHARQTIQATRSPKKRLVVRGCTNPLRSKQVSKLARDK